MIFRTRRFGKILFISMLKAFFEGRADLFEGTKLMSSLYIKRKEYDKSLKQYTNEIIKRNALIAENALDFVENLEALGEIYKPEPPYKFLDPLHKPSVKSKVLDVDFSTIDHRRLGVFETSLKTRLNEIGAENGISHIKMSIPLMSFINKLIQVLVSKSPSKKLACLFNEYDTPMVNN